MNQDFTIHPNLRLGVCQSGPKFSQHCFPREIDNFMNFSDPKGIVGNMPSSSSSSPHSDFSGSSSTNKPLSNSCQGVPEQKLFMSMQIMSDANASLPSQHNTFQAFQDHAVEKKVALHSQGTISVTPNYLLDQHHFSRAPNLSASRVRWTRDLHEKFVKCINRLGGARGSMNYSKLQFTTLHWLTTVATPKGILELMKFDGLTIFHIKSHLQKYRTSKGIPKSIQDGKACTSPTVKLETKTRMELVEALRTQIEVQKNLMNQLEEQGVLQMQIEEEGKKLKEMLAQLKSN